MQINGTKPRGEIMIGMIKELQHTKQGMPDSAAGPSQSAFPCHDAVWHPRGPSQPKPSCGSTGVCCPSLGPPGASRCPGHGTSSPSVTPAQQGLRGHSTERWHWQWWLCCASPHGTPLGEWELWELLMLGWGEEKKPQVLPSNKLKHGSSGFSS